MQSEFEERIIVQERVPVYIKGMSNKWSIRIEGAEHKFWRAADFEAAYFYLLRNRIDCQGSGPDEMDSIDIRRGREVGSRERWFTEVPAGWLRPTTEAVIGALDQFKNQSELARFMHLSRGTLSLWRHQGGQMSYYRWRFLCELMGIVVFSPAGSVEFSEQMGDLLT